jgi:hypothetical protein
VAPKQRIVLRINGLKPNQVTERGMARTFQNIRLFQNMTVLENVMIGRHCRLSWPASPAPFSGARPPAEEKQVVADSYASWRKSAWPVRQRAGQEPALRRPAPPGNRPGHGHRTVFAAAGRTGRRHEPQETRELDELIIRIRDEEKISILLIEHDMKLVMSLSDRIYVVDYGKKIAQGTPRRSRTTRRSSRPTSEKKSMLELKNIKTYYGNIQALKGSASRSRGGDHHPHRRQRRRQDHHPDVHLRHRAPRAGEVLFEGRADPRE